MTLEFALNRVGKRVSCLGLPAAVIALLCMPLLFLEPLVEERFWPIRADQHIENVTRTDQELCWDWVSVKARNLASNNMDVFLTTFERKTPDAPLTETDRAVLSIYGKNDHLPWGRSAVVKVGPHRQSYCVSLPPYVKLGTPLKLEQLAYYPGFFGQILTVRIPEIYSP